LRNNRELETNVREYKKMNHFCHILLGIKYFRFETQTNWLTY